MRFHISPNVHVTAPKQLPSCSQIRPVRLSVIVPFPLFNQACCRARHTFLKLAILASTSASDCSTSISFVAERLFCLPQAGSSSTQQSCVISHSDAATLGNLPSYRCCLKRRSFRASTEVANNCLRNHVGFMLRTSQT